MFRQVFSLAHVLEAEFARVQLRGFWGGGLFCHSRGVTCYIGSSSRGVTDMGVISVGVTLSSNLAR